MKNRKPEIGAKADAKADHELFCMIAGLFLFALLVVLGVWILFAPYL